MGVEAVELGVGGRVGCREELRGGTCGSVASGGQKRTLRGSSSSMSCPQVKHFSSSVVRSSFEENKLNLSTERMFHPGDSKRVPTDLSFQLNS